MAQNDTQKAIERGKTVLGIEFGSTRIKAVLIGEDHRTLAAGSHAWENRYENGVWTYSLEDVWTGLQDCHAELGRQVVEKYALPLGAAGAMGFSGMIQEFTQALGVEVGQSRLFEILYQVALEGDAEAGGLFACNYLSGEHITHFEEGRPLFVRTSESRFTLANFMRVHLFSALAALKIGLDILFEQEQVKVERVLGHGGFFKTRGWARGSWPRR